MNIIETISLAGTVALAIPVMLFGFTQLLSGDLVGLGYLVIAGLMIGIAKWLTTPGDIPELIIERVLERFVKK
ncbi:MAG: hypothetical protein ABEI52_07300 [Halobacteriaceae archaeon]